MDCKQTDIKTTTRRTYAKAGRLVDETEAIFVQPAKLDPQFATCTVSVDKSLTKNLGDYNSFKASVFVSAPCYLDKDEIEGAIKFCELAVDENLSRIFTEEGIKLA